MHVILIAGAALIGLPILLHLIMKQEPKRLPFPALRFLKQKQRTNQRKLRLRHFILLALRMLLIGLFCLALFQPKVPSVFSDVGIDLSGDQPVAAVFVIDTSPSMGYTADKKTRVEEAARRALELLDRLPNTSRVAVLTTADPFATWELSPADARRKLEGLKKPQGSGQPITTVLMRAYQLLSTVDQDGGSLTPELFPRLVAIFSDRTAECWKGDRADDLKAAVARVPAPKVAHLFFDVGIDQPANVSIIAAEVRPSIVPSGTPVTISVTVQATGPDVPASIVRCKLDNAAKPERQEVALTAGTPVPVVFTFKDLKPGLHQAEVSLETPDNLGPEGVPGFDNVRYVTFRVGEGRKILTICDDPDDAAYWKLAHTKKFDFGCDVVTPNEVRDLGAYDIVCLMSVSDPAKVGPDGETLWAKLRKYTERGGKLLVMPGGLEIDLKAYDPSGAAAGLMPTKLVRITDTTIATDPDRRSGVAWFLQDDKVLRHPLLAPIKDWKLSGRVDFLRNPRLAWKYWEVEATPEAIVVSYDDNPDPTKRSPAILEKVLPAGGKVLLLTTSLNSPWDRETRWNNYWEFSESSWATVFPNLLAKYLAGDSAEVSFQFSTGQAVNVPLPKGDSAKAKKFLLEGPNVSNDDANLKIDPTQAEFRLPPDRTMTAGNYVLRTEDRSWQEGFSLNVPAEESNLTKVPKEVIEAVCGADSIIAAGKELDLKTMIEGRSAELQLFPWLLIAVLVIFALEGVFANRFYRLRTTA